jgi:hypothetical protein
VVCLTKNQPNLDEDEIMIACDHPREAAAIVAKYRRCSFAEALALVEAWRRPPHWR